MESGNLFWIFLTVWYSCSSIPGTHALPTPKPNLRLNPMRVVVEYGGSVSVDCSTDIKGAQLGFEAPHDGVDMTEAQMITWKPKSVTEWGLKPTCYINIQDTQEELKLDIVLYKRPNRVSVSPLNPMKSLKEGQQYELRCDVQNVAPVNLLTVNWYRGDTLLKKQTFKDRTDPKPVDVSDTLMITASRSDEGVKFRCEAVQELGPEGPQPPPTVTSETLNFTVHYPPSKILGLESATVKCGQNKSLTCSSDAKPQPSYKWIYPKMSNVKISIINGVPQLSITEASESNSGNYTCSASNELGEVIRTVSVDVNALNGASGLRSRRSFLITFSPVETGLLMLAHCELLIFTLIVGIICNSIM